MEWSRRSMVVGRGGCLPGLHNICVFLHSRQNYHDRDFYLKPLTYLFYRVVAQVRRIMIGGARKGRESWLDKTYDWTPIYQFSLQKYRCSTLCVIPSNPHSSPTHHLAASETPKHHPHSPLGDPQPQAPSKLASHPPASTVDNNP